VSEPLIFGMLTEPIPERWTPFEAIAVLKCLDEDGEVALCLRSTESLRSWDSVGMLTVALDTSRARAAAGFVGDDDDDD
jgi:hypothetical protein